MLTSRQHTPLSLGHSQQLADALGESPATAAAVNALRWGNCTAYTLQEPPHFGAAIIEVAYLPGEPFVFATDAPTLCQLLQQVTGWPCVLAPTELAQEFGLLLTSHTGKAVRYYTDIGYELPRPVVPISDPTVRLLGLEDLPLLAQLPIAPVGLVLTKAPALLTASLLAGAVVNNQLVAIADADAPQGRYAEIGIETQPEWRGRGLAAAAASLVAQRLQAAGRIPVWSTGEDNWASQRVAQKLGFIETFRRLYVIPEEQA